MIESLFNPALMGIGIGGRVMSHACELGAVRGDLADAWFIRVRMIPHACYRLRTVACVRRLSRHYIASASTSATRVTCNARALRVTQFIAHDNGSTRHFGAEIPRSDAASNFTAHFAQADHSATFNLQREPILIRQKNSDNRSTLLTLSRISRAYRPTEFIIGQQLQLITICNK